MSIGPNKSGLSTAATSTMRGNMVPQASRIPMVSTGAIAALRYDMREKCRVRAVEDASPPNRPVNTAPRRVPAILMAK